ncbi:MAG TPA: hypothetical protein VHX59_23475 [Mycobacteriales bacterium]|nr:hypothetical protein [Mycobacteriales bacterium]
MTDYGAEWILADERESLSIARLPMRQLAGCETGPCPKVFYNTETDEFDVQGTNVAAMPLTTIPDDEKLVRIPGAIMRQAIAAYRAGA